MNEKKEVKLKFYGGVGWVTGANFVIENIPHNVDEKITRIMIDCGMYQGGEEAGPKNREDFVYDPSTIDILVLTHAHADHLGRIPKLVRDGFDHRVWIVSPTTCMATLNTMRAILKDARMREQAGAIRSTLQRLQRDVELVVERVDKLNTHFGQARKDLDGISTAAERAGKRAARLDNFDFEELTPEEQNNVVPLAKPEP